MKKLLTALLLISFQGLGQNKIDSPSISTISYYDKYPDFNYHTWGLTIDSLLNCTSFYVIDESNEMTAIIVFENSVSFYYNGNILILNNKGGMLWNGIMIDRNTRQNLDELKHFWSKFNRKK